MNEPHIIATESGLFATYTLYSDRVVVCQLNEGLTIDEETARVGIQHLEEFVGTGPYAAVVDGRDMGYATPEGRAALRATVGTHRVATALIAGSPGVEYAGERVIAEGGLSKHTAMFASLGESLTWARSKLAESQE